MKKMRSLILTLSAALLIGLIWNIPVTARVTGTYPGSTTPDRWCVGSGTAEVCLDFSGNWIPTTDSSATLGTTALRWATAYVDSLTVTNDVSVGGDFRVTMPDAETITAGGTITADGCGTVKRITAADPVTTDTTNTFTAPGSTNAGCVMYLVNVGTNTITLDANANFVSAGASNVSFTSSDALTVASDGTDWYQISAVLAN